MKNKLIPRSILQDFPKLGHNNVKGQAKAKTLSFLVNHACVMKAPPKPQMMAFGDPLGW